MSGGTEYAEALVRAEAEIARLRRELERRAGAASPAPRDGACATCGRDLTCGSCRWFPGQPGGLCRLPDARPHLIDRETPACVAYEARAAPRDEDGVREALIAMGERWHACNEGRGPTAVENERRKCARELLRFARALAPPSPPSGPETSEEGYCECGHASMAHYAGGCLIVGGQHGGCGCKRFRAPPSGEPGAEKGRTP